MKTKTAIAADFGLFLQPVCFLFTLFFFSFLVSNLYGLYILSCLENKEIEEVSPVHLHQINVWCYATCSISSKPICIQKGCAWKVKFPLFYIFCFSPVHEMPYRKRWFHAILSFSWIYLHVATNSIVYFLDPFCWVLYRCFSCGRHCAVFNPISYQTFVFYENDMDTSKMIFGAFVLLHSDY